MKAPILNTTISAATLALASCSDPAEKTTDATVAESAPVATSSQDTTYSFTQNSAIGFVGSKVTGSHEGGFKKFSGHFVVHNGTPEAGEFTIQMDSTWSDNEKLTGHLKAPDFFDVEQFPVSTFEVTAFTRKSDQQYELSGNLTLHGETKNITFPTQVTQTGDTVRVHAEFDINRKDFGIVYPGKPDDLIRDNVVIKFDLEAKAKAKAEA